MNGPVSAAPAETYFMIMVHEYPAVVLQAWQLERQEWERKEKHQVAKDDGWWGLEQAQQRNGFYNCKVLSSVWKHVQKRMEVPPHWACCTSPAPCPEPHQKRFPACGPTSVQSCRSRCCLLAQQTSALPGQKWNWVKVTVLKRLFLKSLKYSVLVHREVWSVSLKLSGHITSTSPFFLFSENVVSQSVMLWMTTRDPNSRSFVRSSKSFKKREAESGEVCCFHVYYWD